ncbi:hypothetical protein Ndes2526B_g02540 [Nannochloris sp. 'desiccata']
MVASEGITAAQTIRNMVMGVSILAAGITLLASQLLLLLTDPARLVQVAKYSKDDPISGSNSLMSPEIKLGICLAILFVALLTMTQCPLALLISTIVEVIALFLMDLTPDDLAYEDDETEQQVEDEIVRTTSMRRISLTERGNNSGAGGGVDGNGGEGLKPRVPYVSVE